MTSIKILIPCCQEAIKLQLLLFGTSLRNPRLLKFRLWYVFGAMMGQKHELAEELLSETYQRHCCAPWDTLTKDDFLFLYPVDIPIKKYYLKASIYIEIIVSNLHK